MTQNGEANWFLSAELPLVFEELHKRFDDFKALLYYLEKPLSKTAAEVTAETIPLSSTLKDDHVKGHIKMKGPLITKTELHVEINNTAVPVKTQACIKEEEQNPWRLNQLGYAANYLFLVKQRCKTLSEGSMPSLEKAQEEVSLLLDDLRRCKLQLVLPPQDSISMPARNYSCFSLHFHLASSLTFTSKT